MTLGENLAREYTYITSIGRTFYRMRRVKPDAQYTITDIVEDLALTKPNNIAIICGAEFVTYRQLVEGANRYTRWALGQGIRRGDVVALLMTGRPEYIMAWLGLVKLGAIVALLNTQLTGTSLAHCIDVAGARWIILGSELAENYLNAARALVRQPIVWATGGRVPGSEDLDFALAESSRLPVARDVRDGLTAKDTAFYIYTSGTTGLPKAAHFSHMRMLFMMFGFGGALGARESDRMYDTLPLYHSTGGVCAVGVALTTGGSLVIRPKFSAHEFWQDCHTYQPTFFQYIGELCRYLLNTPEAPHERNHCLRAITGNGLRPEIWATFQKRFNIPRIIEFYGATEGNVGMLNYEGKLGSIGRIPRYMRGIIATRLVKFDFENEVPIRDAKGRCVECAVGEVGETIGKVVHAPGRNFEGYTDASAGSKKILQDVFEMGDVWYRTGDLMKRDAQDYFYFVDRIGDTFRWKGENVATSEVAEALGVVPGIVEANVYGVAVPGHDGRAGMAALVTEPDFDPATLAEILAGNLPPYARPVFLRLRRELEVTGTFKQRKVNLVKEGCDPDKIKDPLHVFNADNGRYESLDAARYADIASGRVRL